MACHASCSVGCIIGGCRYVPAGAERDRPCSTSRLCGLRGTVLSGRSRSRRIGSRSSSSRIPSRNDRCRSAGPGGEPAVPLRGRRPLLVQLRQPDQAALRLRRVEPRDGVAPDLQGLSAHSAELFARADPTGFLVKGYAGLTGMQKGWLNDEDFTPFVDPYSSTMSTQRGGNSTTRPPTSVIRCGSPRASVSALVGYSYIGQEAPMAAGRSAATRSSVSLPSITARS